MVKVDVLVLLNHNVIQLITIQIYKEKLRSVSLAINYELYLFQEFSLLMLKALLEDDQIILLDLVMGILELMQVEEELE